jgi:hypothetical protein
MNDPFDSNAHRTIPDLPSEQAMPVPFSLPAPSLGINELRGPQQLKRDRQFGKGTKLAEPLGTASKLLDTQQLVEVYSSEHIVLFHDNASGDVHRETHRGTPNG